MEEIARRSGVAGIRSIRGQIRVTPAAGPCHYRRSPRGETRP